MEGPFEPRAAIEPPIEVLAPSEQLLPLVFASPHSGSDYPAEFLAASRLDPLTLRRSEDSYVDEIFAAAVELGAPLLRARFPRAYLDPNRERDCHRNTDRKRDHDRVVGSHSHRQRRTQHRRKDRFSSIEHYDGAQAIPIATPTSTRS